MEEQENELEQQETLEEEIIEEETVTEENLEQESERVSKKKEQDREPSNPKKSNKQKLQIVISAIVLVVVLIGVVVFFLLNGKNDKKENNSNSNSNSNSSSNVEEPVNYQEIVNEYGTKLEELVSNYTKQNGKTPDLNGILEYAKVGDYKISCKEQKITSSKKIYLGECSVNDSVETYSYGEKEEAPTYTSSLNVYKGDSGYGTEYRFEIYEGETNNFTKIASVPCDAEKCSGYIAYEQYVIIQKMIPDGNKENWYYYLYDYQNNKYLDFELADSYEFEILDHNNKLYGLYYEQNKKDYIYSIQAGKTFNVNGSYQYTMGWDASPMLVAGYAPISNSNVTDFVNLKNGSVVYSIKNVSSFYEDIKAGKVYITQYIEKGSGENASYTYKIYDSKGYVLFGGEEFDGFYVENNTLVTWKDHIFKTYNSNYQNTYTSKAYDSIVDIWENYVLVLEGTNLNLVDYKGNTLTTFIKDWSDEKYYYHSMISGWYTEKGKNGIYLIIEEDDVSKSEILKENPGMTAEDLDAYDLGYEYYYIPSTKESGKIPTYIGGYAKPILYLYPLLPTLVNVTFKNPSSLTTTYPKYENGWTVFANPNGDLRDLKNKYYYGLYWEEDLNHRVDFKEGFYVTKENAIDFLEEKLTIIGLNDRERNEFIMYWLPVLEKNGKNLVYFELTEERDFYSPITISPKPNSMLRIAIHVKKVDKEVKIKEQKLTTFTRTGFTAVEWGGVTY